MMLNTGDIFGDEEVHSPNFLAQSGTVAFCLDLLHQCVDRLPR
jgi:hypothetical protein